MSPNNKLNRIGIRVLSWISICGLLFFGFIATFYLGRYYQIVAPKRTEVSFLAHSTSKVPSSLEHVDKIVFTGDSLTAYGDLHGGFIDSFRVYLRAIYPEKTFVVVGAGIAGETSGQIQQRFTKDAIAQKPQVVFVCSGTNDMRLNIPLSTFEENVRKMINEAGKNNIEVYLISIPISEDAKPRPREEEFNAALKKLAAEQQVHYVDLNKVMAAVRAQYIESTGSQGYFLTVDGIHFSAAGNNIVCQQLLTGVGVPLEARNHVRLLSDPMSVR